MKEKVEDKLNNEIKDLKEEIMMAKKILKDPNLSTIVTRKFNAHIDKDNDNKMLIEGAEIKTII